MMKRCELCKSPANVYCESDQASLCWSCDNKVHSANFLVAKHSRSLLCRVCKSPTPWMASGDKLGPSAVSVCEKCVDGSLHEESENKACKNKEEVQVVPLCYSPPPAASSSSSDDCFSRSGLKRKRANNNVTDRSSQDDVECLSVQKNRRVLTAEFTEETEGNGRTLYNFLPLTSEAMGEKVMKN